MLFLERAFCVRGTGLLYGGTVGECIYLQYASNRNYYCTLCNEQGLAHPNCECYVCNDYRNVGYERIAFAERIETSEQLE